MRMTPFVLSAAALLLAAPAIAADETLPPDPTPAQLEPGRLADAGFDSIDKVAKAGRTVRRATYNDIYTPTGAPGVLLEKMADGQVNITITSNRGMVVDKAVLKPEAWDIVTAQDKALFAKTKATVSNDICMGSTVVVETADHGKAKRRDAAVCNAGADLAAMEYARTLAFVAVTSIPRCQGYVENTRDASWTLRDCLRRSLVSDYKRSPYSSASGDNSEKFQTFAIKTENNITPELMKQFARTGRYNFNNQD